jgi:hypothetical protein
MKIRKIITPSYLVEGLKVKVVLVSARKPLYLLIRIRKSCM